MPLELSQMLEEDIDAFGVLDEIAMAEWTFARLMDTSGRPRREFAAEWARNDWGKDEKAHWLKINDTETGEMVAMAMWRMPIQNDTIDGAEPERPADAEGSIQSKAVSDAERQQKQFWLKVETMKKDFFSKFIGSKPHACELAILPSVIELTSV